LKIQIIGAAGYVGSVTAACLAEAGHEVVGVDADPDKVAKLMRGESPIYEPGLAEILDSTIKSGHLRFVGEPEYDRFFDLIFITVGTPPDLVGSLAIEPIKEIVRQLAPALGRRETIVVIKSTVPVGTCRLLAGIMKEGGGVPAAIASNPEFLKEGRAIEDFKRPDRVVVGTQESFVTDKLLGLYLPFLRSGNPFYAVSLETAEFSKLAANAALASRISLMNEFAGLAEATGADIDDVRKVVGSDKRIGPHFLYPGPGYGGSCFPKDVGALVVLGREHRVPVSLIGATELVNLQQKQVLFHKLQTLIPDLQDKRIAVWGLAFKPETDDVRESPAFPLINSLLRAGARVQAYDPKANANFAKAIGNHTFLRYCDSAVEAANSSDALVIVTDWNEFKTHDFAELGELMRSKVVVDGRNLFQPEVLRKLGFAYASIGRQ
jgi:UDPglucose 6-dehydrogenase